MKRLVTLVLVGLVVSACSSIDTTLDYNPDVNFQEFRTYKWIGTDGQASDNFAHDRIVRAINNTLQARGLTMVETGGDLHVGYQVTTDQRSNYTTVSAGWGGYGWGRRGWWGGGTMGVSTSQTTESRYTVGTIIVGMFDPGSKDLVWTGTASDTIRPNQTPAERQAHVQEAVDKMLRDFPPGS